MPIPVSCSCGKSFAAPDKFAGKRVKCPACAEPVQIPAGAAEAAEGTAQAGKPKTLKVACSCGKTLMVKAELAGKAVKCPSCGKPVRIGTAQQAAANAAKPAAAVSQAGGGMDDLLDEVDLRDSATGHRCPECRNDLQPGDIICVKCGYNLETGKKLHTRSTRKVDPIEKLKGIPPGGAKSKKAGESFDVSQQPWLIVALVLFIPTAILWFVNAGLAITTLVLLSWLASMIAGVWILIVAFQDSVLQGVLCFLVPFYALFYIATHWEETKAAAGILAVSIVASILANVILVSVMPAA